MTSCFWVSRWSFRSLKFESSSRRQKIEDIKREPANKRIEEVVADFLLQLVIHFSAPMQDETVEKNTATGRPVVG